MNTDRKDNKFGLKKAGGIIFLIVVILIGFMFMSAPSTDNSTTSSSSSSSIATTTTTNSSTTTTIIHTNTTSTTTVTQENTTTFITITRGDRKRTFMTEISLPPEAEGKLEVKIHIEEDGYMVIKLKNIGEQVINKSSGFYMGIHYYGGINGAELKGEFEGRQIRWTIMPGEIYSVNSRSLWADSEIITSFKIEILYIP